jgi:hypothetical protein
MCFACFHVHLRNGLTLFGGDPASIKIFRLQKKVIRIIGTVSRYVSYKNLFKDLNMLPVPGLYTSEVVCSVKSNLKKMKHNEAVHDHCTCHKSDLHTQFCRTTLFKNSSGNVCIKLFNKLPETINRL